MRRFRFFAFFPNAKNRTLHPVRADLRFQLSILQIVSKNTHPKGVINKTRERCFALPAIFVVLVRVFRDSQTFLRFSWQSARKTLKKRKTRTCIRRTSGARFRFFSGWPLAASPKLMPKRAGSPRFASGAPPILGAPFLDLLALRFEPKWRLQKNPRRAHSYSLRQPCVAFDVLLFLF